MLRSAIQQKAFPGASVAITYCGKLIGLKGVGHFTYKPDSTAVTGETIYDLASVSKAVATTTACMLLHEQGKFHLEQKLVEVLPEFGGEDSRREQVTFRMLLAHSSGLPAYVKLFQSAKDKQELLRQAYAVPLVADPGSHAEYSDVGFILLGEAVERIAGEALDHFCGRNIFEPLGLDFMAFNPPHHWHSLIPPTEDDRSFRHKIVQGEVNDENAWVMGGVAGHAGCFGRAVEVAVFAECMLRGGAPLLNKHTVDLFTRREPSPLGTSRTLGWDTPSAPSQSGNYFSARSYGHLGYTGTSLWIDPERRLSVTLLTNRTWPDRGAQAIKQIRPEFHNAVVEALQ